MEALIRSFDFVKDRLHLRNKRKKNFSLVFFSLIRNFAIKIIKSGREEVKFTREDKHS